MAEYIERGALLKLSAERYKDFCEKSGRSLALDGAILWLKLAVNQTPTADVAEVVRCKDCERMVAKDGMYVCNHALPTKSLTQYIATGTDILAIVQPDDFCSYGERRNDAAD